MILFSAPWTMSHTALALCSISYVLPSVHLSIGRSRFWARRIIEMSMGTDDNYGDDGGAAVEGGRHLQAITRAAFRLSGALGRPIGATILGLFFTAPHSNWPAKVGRPHSSRRDSPVAFDSILALSSFFLALIFLWKFIKSF